MSYEILNNVKEKMEKAVVHFENELKSIRTGQANANMLDGVEVEYYGSLTPVKQIASISISEGTQFVIKPYDSSSLKDIEKAINTSDLGLVPQNDGSLIRLNVPKLTEETRKEMVKKVSKLAEENKVIVRNVRRDANDLVKKDKEMTEDAQKDCLNEIQKLTDSFIKKLDDIASAKEKEVMKV
ncbi:MAG: ribosome recycling factor [Erysipelotrichaceae bacterium]|nr:ribosome recycling factor [Erysipelotrichaceae bacterium]